MPIEISMPALSPTMTEGNLAKWFVKEGDEVAAGEVIAEIETDKATMEVEAIEEGIIGRIIIQAGTKSVAVNEVIAVLLEEGEDSSILDDYKIKESETPKSQQNEKIQEVTTENKPQNNQSPNNATSNFTPPPVMPIITSNNIVNGHKRDDANIKASPLAKKMAKAANIDLKSLIGTGPRGRIVKSDVEEAIKTGGKSRIMRNPVEYDAIENSNMRQVIAKRLLQSKQHVPHFYLNIDCNLDKLLSARSDINDLAQIGEQGKPTYKISVNDLIIKAVALALRDIPEANASWSDEATILYNNVDISVAVAIDGGLITPIIKNADQKNIVAISNEMKDLAKRAKENALAPEEFQGGGFSISNLGMFGVKNFSAIINPPQSCILAIGAGEKRAIVQDDNIVIANMMTVTLSCDHRVVDGAVGANFLAAFKKYVEKPVSLLI